MSFLINSLIVLRILFPSSLMAGKNPFSITFNSEPLELQGETRQTIKITVASNSIEDARYYLKLHVPRAHMKVLEGRDTYTGDIAPLKTKDHYITVRLKEEGEGKLTAAIYGYIDDRDIDTSNPNKFVADYSVSKSTKTTGKDYLLSIASTNEQTMDLTDEAGPEGMTPEAEDEEKLDEEQGQRFILGSKAKDNALFRNLLFVLSFVLIGWFAYRIINRQL